MYAERIHSPQQYCGHICRCERKSLHDKRALGVQGIIDAWGVNVSRLRRPYRAS